MLFLGRQLRTRLDALKPDVMSAVRLTQDSQILRRAARSKHRQFAVGETVLARNYRGTEKWRQGVVSTQSGPVSYTVDVGETDSWRRHADQLLPLKNQTSPEKQVMPETALSYCQHIHSALSSPGNYGCYFTRVN